MNRKSFNKMTTKVLFNAMNDFCKSVAVALNSL